MKRYFAIFKQTKNTVEVSFPDLKGCVTFGKNLDDALDKATDVLGGWLANADDKFIKKPSTYKTLSKQLKKTEQLVPIAVDSTILESYQQLKRFNVIFPANTLAKVDDYRKEVGMKRSKILQLAAEEYIARHPQ